MYILRRFIAITLLLGSFNLNAQTRFTLGSPNQQLALTVVQNNQHQWTYELSFKGKQVIQPSLLGVRLSQPAADLTILDLVQQPDSTTHDDTWQPVLGELKNIRNHYKALTLQLVSTNNPAIRMNVAFRLFDDGLGFRYEWPQQPAVKYAVLAEEMTQFSMAGNHKAFWIPGDFDSNEYAYNTSPLSEVHALTAAAKEKDIAVTALINDRAVQTPLMMKSADGLYINIHEAALRNYPAMNLQLNPANYQFSTVLVPDAVGNKAYLQLPCSSPWRTIIVSDKATEILASKLILNLNEPAAPGDKSWIKPQKFIGVWWEMHTGKGTWQLEGGKHAANTNNVKKYIDFASQHGFDGVLVEGWNTGWEDWFGNWKENVFDFVTPYADYDVAALTAYAQSKNVRIIMHHETSGAATNYERWMDTAYRFMVNHRMNTVKTGYVGKIIPRGEHHDGQWMVNHYEWVAQKTADYHIMLVAHEPVRPTGLQRTFPNWLASEAARGSEFNNAPTLGITPEHTTILPFTRFMGGPMDFTPGLFHFQLNQFDSSRKQRVRTTLAKQLALYITIYSPVQMAADLPENYNQHLDAFQFIKDVATDWDNTVILEAEPGDYLSIARQQKGTNNWFVGGITDENSRTSIVNCSFLEAGKKYQAIIYRDAADANWETNPTAYVIEKKTITSKTKLSIQLASSGGYAISIQPLP